MSIVKEQTAKNKISINLKPLNKEAEKIFKTLLSKMENGYVSIDNTNSVFMPVVVEKIFHENKYGDVYSIAHYYEQNGDLMRDPEMTFLLNDRDKRVYPISFQMDGIFSVFEKNAIFKHKELWKFYKRKNNEHKNFANQWMKNIKSQQKL